MKKKIVQAKARSTSRGKAAVPKNARAQQNATVSIQRIVIISACVVIALVGVLLSNKRTVNQSVAGMSIARGIYAQATVVIPEVSGAVSFNIYYKKRSDNSFDNAVRAIPVTAKSYTISYLKRGTSYNYKIVAVDAKGSEFWFSPTRPLLGIKSM